MRKFHKRICCLALVLALMPMAAGCSGPFFGGLAEREDGLGDDAYTEDILPESLDDAYAGKITATLYYRYLTEAVLTGVEREFSVTAEKTLEELAVQALIDGPPETQYQFGALIDQDTRLVSVKAQSGYLSITLSSEFLEPMDEDIDREALRRRLAVQSIVNTVTAIGNYSRVLILIDQNGTGNGERLTYAQAGWEEYGDRTMEPMARDTSAILTPEYVLGTVLDAIVEKDYERLELFLAQRDYDGKVCPPRADLIEALGAKASIVSFALAGAANVSGDGTRAVASVDITYIDANGHTSVLEDLPIRMMREDVWKVSFPSLETMFPDY